MSVEAHVNILLVDDKAENLLALLEQDFAAIVLDVQMPGMDGIELAQLIRSRRRSHHVPILFLTAHGDDSAIAGYEAGAVDFLTKPLQPAVLRSKVGVFAELFRKTRALAAEVEERRQAELHIAELNRQLSARVDELAAANAELESFSYTVSHDLRAPLRQVSGFVALLEEGMAGRVTPEDRQYVELIQSAVARMGQLIDDLLSFSRVGRAEIHRSVVDLNALVEQVRQTLAPASSGREVIWEIEPLPLVEGDAAMLRQVLASLLDNALKFTRPRNRAVIGINATAQSGEHVIAVRDNGVGFDPRHVDKLFGVFQRLHGQDEFEGTGIGLASVRRIVHRHGGRTWAHSTPDQGAIIYFTLPGSTAHEQAA